MKFTHIVKDYSYIRIINNTLFASDYYSNKFIIKTQVTTDYFRYAAFGVANKESYWQRAHAKTLDTIVKIHAEEHSTYLIDDQEFNTPQELEMYLALINN